MGNEGLSWLDRLKRHYVGRVVIPYAVVIGFAMQIAARVFPIFGWSRAVPVLVIVLVASLPVVLVLTWLLARPADGSQSSAWQHRHRKFGMTVSVLVVALAAISGFFAWQFSATRALDQRPVTTARIAAKSIAVLPFENLSADKDNEYFVAGMQGLVLTKLADIADLKVISRTSTAKYVSHPVDLKTIGRQLDVAIILEGSVQKAGDQVLINVRLIDVRTDAHIWAQEYQRTLDNIFGVEGEVAEKIAAALQAKLSPAESAQLAEVPTANQAAYDLFLRAEYHANRGLTNYDTASWKAAIPLYRQAIGKDPGFALAWARLSYAESNLYWFNGGGDKNRQLREQARKDAERALKLAPNLAASQLAIGYSDYWGRRDYVAALKAFDRALALRPNDAEALAARGYVERRLGHSDAAITALTQALTLDPRNSALAFELGGTYMMASRYADAENSFRRALALEPDNLNAKAFYSNAVLLGSGDVARALTAAQGDAAKLKLQRMNLLAYQRKYHDAIALLESVPDTADNFSEGNTFFSKSLQLAVLYWMASDEARARPLFAGELARLRAEMAERRGLGLAFGWQRIATAELGLGHREEGLKAITKAQAVVEKSEDQLLGSELTQTSAGLYAQAQRADLAVPLLVKALAMPGIGYSYSPVMLWLDPVWDPIRHDPSFEALLQQYAKYKPAVTYPALSASM